AAVARSSMLTWHSSFAALTGYSGSSLRYVLGLDALGIPVRPLYLYGTDYDEQVQAGGMHPRIRELQAGPLRLDAPQVVYAPGDRFSKNSGRYRIGFTMLETDRLPASWVEQANQMDELWTPSAWGAEVFRASGVRPPVHVVPLGVDAARFRPADAPRERLRDRTIFLSVFEWGERKGWDVLLRAWRAAFAPDDPVLLLLKIDCRMPLPNPVHDLSAALAGPHAPIGLIYNQPLSGAQLLELYQGCDCFVLPSRGEGWGMPILEAMACGVPAIATDWSAPTTFLNAQNGYPLPIRGLAPTGSTALHYRDAQWAVPDEDALVELLRRAARNPDERRALGRAAREEAERWPWGRGVGVVAERVRALATP
ncbi:hypothetical protein SE17_34500, partial [Kouleothrix aurantiaca]